ncbi:MAG TPA: hypothetical protein VGX25_06765 [Actinophytocola sp.]|uniref:hypothetical protein n=1 Tax=Actinophytocola sp. TaxID=1872138 RepID=UPI002DDCF8E8|nr:hypothetical protein [Actinophytocola sp.]HEV2779090.1 hypothetical protein [Actinophytocola sp.]
MTPSLPVTYAEFLAGKRTAAPHVVDMVVLRQVCALIDVVRREGPDAQFEHVASWIRADPDHVATVAVVLAAIAPDDAVEPGRVLELVARHPVDVSEIARLARSLWNKYTKRHMQHLAPNWVRVGRRIRDRLNYAAREQRRRQDARSRAG